MMKYQVLVRAGLTVLLLTEVTEVRVSVEMLVWRGEHA